ncbi:MAG TPA: NAD-dependent epimerase/dehydratase family protein [Tepidisphaeraceae bacterium]|nr:NAD-dependent epimerase/dehydratase family protein [Tepidisphaeraceae bacterium]
MRVLIIGGTGLISTGIVKHLRARSGAADITMLNRGRRENTLPADVKHVAGDRNDFAAFESAFRDQRFDVVIDMICFTPQQAESDVRAFGGQCGHFIFCSTVCTYGGDIPPGVVVDESFEQRPVSQYGRDKLECERIFLRAHEARAFPVTIVRPSCTYGPGSRLIDNIETDPPAWDRIERGLPVLCSGDGLGLWVATHRDDVGKLFAYGAMNAKTFGQSYNATRDENFTWRDFYRQAAAALGKPAEVLFMPADWIIKHDPQRFGLLREITRYHGAYSSEKAKRDVPEFHCDISFQQGAGETLADVRRRGEWKSADSDALYDQMVKKALAAGVEPVRV